MENPTNFSNKIDYFQSYNKAPHRIIPSTGQSEIKPGDTTIFTLPIKTLDMRTFRLNFDAFTSGTNAQVVGFPQFMATMIEQLDIYVNGISIQHIPLYGFVYKTMKDYSISYEEALMKIGSNPDPSVTTTLTDAGVPTKYVRHRTTGVAAVNQFQDEYVIDDWLGFIGTCEPSIFNTNLVGTFEVHIRWAPASVLWGEGADWDYTIRNLYAYIDVIDWKDTGYFQGLESKISAEGGMKVPYKNYRTHIGTALANTKSSTTRFTESTQSLDKIIFTYLDALLGVNAGLQLGTPADVLPTFLGPDAADILAELNASLTTGHPAPSDFNYEVLKAKNDPNLLNTSRYFKRNGLGLKGGSVQFEINSQDIPSFQLSLLGGYEETLKAFELNESNLHKINPGIRDLAKYERDFYACALSTSHINDKRLDYLISGKDTQATSMNIAVKATQNPAVRALNVAQAATPIVITEMSAVLHIGSGRECSVSF